MPPTPPSTPNISPSFSDPFKEGQRGTFSPGTDSKFNQHHNLSYPNTGRSSVTSNLTTHGSQQRRNSAEHIQPYPTSISQLMTYASVLKNYKANQMQLHSLEANPKPASQPVKQSANTMQTTNAPYAQYQSQPQGVDYIAPNYFNNQINKSKVDQINSHNPQTAIINQSTPDQSMSRVPFQDSMSSSSICSRDGAGTRSRVEYHPVYHIETGQVHMLPVQVFLTWF